MGRWGAALALSLFALGFFASSGRAEAPFEIASKAYEALTLDTASFQNPFAWRSVAERFASAATGEKGAEALYMAGMCFERAQRLSNEPKDIDKALTHYRHVEEEFEKSPFADDALFRSARLYENLGEIDRAEALYKRIVKSYPDGDMQELAQRRLPELRKTVELLSIRHRSGSAYTRIVVDMTGLAPYSVLVLKADPAKGKPPRIFVDVKRAKIAASCQQKREVMDGLVTQARAGQYGKDVARIVLDLKTAATYRVFPLLDPNRLVIDVFRETNVENPPPGVDPVAALIQRSQADFKVGKGTKGAESAVRRRNGSGRRIRVVIDPGHGGKDPGAIGPGKTQEKDVTLKMAKAVRRLLQERMGCEVLLTRDKDETLTLPGRAATANAMGADLFLSIHANAAPNRTARGIETYYLDRSSDRSAMRVAALENSTSETGVRETEQILADIILNMKLPESKRLAQTIQAAILARVAKRHGPVRDLGVKRAPFYVLTGAVMPAVLIETAFISNPAEEKWLEDPKYQETIADAVSAAVAGFFNDI